MVISVNTEYTKTYLNESNNINSDTSFVDKVEQTTDNSLNLSREETGSNTKVTQGIIGEKVKLINGKEIEVKKFLELLYAGQPNRKELDFYWKKLSDQDKKSISTEMILKVAYDFLQNKIDFEKLDNLIEELKIITSDNSISEIFDAVASLSVEELREQEKGIIGDHSYLNSDF